MFSESEHNYVIDSDPPGANVVLITDRGVKPVGVTPVEVPVNLSEQVTFRLEQTDVYYAELYRPDFTYNPWFWLNFLNFGWGFFVDASTGAAFEPAEDTHVQIILKER
ncbi:MAG: hypothetical protein KDK27_11450 [Leptospiraceae bacterium]|nr:hypothetical protein [Leptospiraceae bacterium]